MTTKFHLYEYEWYDHTFTSGWQQSIDNRKYIVFSVGYLIDEDKDHYYFTDGLVPSNAQYNGYHQILKSAIKRKKKLKTIVFQ